MERLRELRVRLTVEEFPSAEQLPRERNGYYDFVAAARPLEELRKKRNTAYHDLVNPIRPKDHALTAEDKALWIRGNEELASSFERLDQAWGKPSIWPRGWIDNASEMEHVDGSLWTSYLELTRLLQGNCFLASERNDGLAALRAMRRWTTLNRIYGSGYYFMASHFIYREIEMSALVFNRMATRFDAKNAEERSEAAKLVSLFLDNTYLKEIGRTTSEIDILQEKPRHNVPHSFWLTPLVEMREALRLEQAAYAYA